MADAAELLRQATEVRASGEVPAARALLVHAFRAARAAEDIERMAQAALGLTTVMGFGVHPGQAPAYLHETLLATPEPTWRVRLLAGLARAWVYGGEADRASAFADDALQLAGDLGDDGLLADALEAALVSRWSPDDFAERISLASRLDRVSAHLPDPEIRLTAALWRLTTAWECLDVVGVARQLLALDLLEEETGSQRVAFYARSRRAMHALVVGTADEAGRLVDEVFALGEGLGEADVLAVTKSLRAELLRREGRTAELAAEADQWEAFARSAGIPSIIAQTAYYRLCAGQTDRAGQLVDELPLPDALPSDVDLLLTASMVQHVASATGRRELAASAVRVLRPYAGRAVLNAGAVTFHGVVDHYLGDLGTAWSAYRRLGARTWAAAVGGAPAVPPSRLTVHLHQDEGGWTVGREDALLELPDLRGLHHLRTLLLNPGVEVEALDLVGAEAVEPDAGPVIDDQAKRAYRRRLADLDAEIDEADRWSDPVRQERALLEREALLHELTAAVGLAGRDRRVGGSAERARTAVRRAVTAAVKRIEASDPVLARLLRDGLRTGTRCSWQPDPGRPVTWVLR